MKLFSGFLIRKSTELEVSLYSGFVGYISVLKDTYIKKNYGKIQNGYT